MGHPKWSLERDGQPWYSRSIQTLGPLCERVLLSVSGVSGWPEGVERIHDLWPSRGPLAAWATFTAIFPGRDLLSVPVDMTSLETRDLAPLIGTVSGHLVSPVGSHYLAAFVRASDLTKLSVPSDAKLGSVAAFWEHTPHTVRPLDATRALDANTPESGLIRNP